MLCNTLPHVHQACSLTEGIRLQRETLRNLYSEPMAQLAQRCAETADDQTMQAELVQELLTSAITISQFSSCKHLFVLDHDFFQITPNITREGPDQRQYGRNRRGSPYTVNIVGKTDFKLSQAYISRHKHRPSLTAIQVIRDQQGELIGFLGADFDLRELPHTEQCYREPDKWNQLKGDPAIRRGLFAQQRVDNIMDDNIDDALDTMHELMTACGIYHSEIQFSRSRATVWHQDDPYTYHLLTINELTSPDILLAFPQHEYFERAQIPVNQIKPVLDMFRHLRFADENIYLRSGSINLVNAMVVLNFSCDGTHYMRFDEFLDKDIGFWFGSTHN